MVMRYFPIVPSLYHFMNRCFLDKMSAYLMPLALILAVITELYTKDFFIKKKLFGRYFLVSFILICICEVVGILIFDTSVLIIFQHEIFFIVAEFLKIVGVHIDSGFMRLLSYWFDMVYDTFTYLVWTFGVTYWVYCLYYHNKKELFQTVVKTGLVCFSLIAFYAVIEIFYFQGSGTARDILITCNPYLHRVGDGYGWWPPLLWGGEIQRMRSIFAEPSYMGIYFAFLTPFLWAEGIKNDRTSRIHIFDIAVFFGFLMMFLTRSRTAYGITILQLTLLTVLIFWQRKHEYFYSVKKICGLCICAAIMANFITGINISGFTDLENNSNNSRLGYIVATTRIGLQHPIFGTGNEIFNYYIEKNSPEFTRENEEYQIWVKYFRSSGISSAYPQMCEYSTIFAKHGLIGIAVFLLPFLVAIVKLGKNKILVSSKDFFIEYIIVIISLIGMFFTGFSNNINISYCYWIVLGIAFVCADLDEV